MKRAHWTSGMVAASLMAGMAAPLAAQETQPVSPAEHEQLKAELEAMRFRLDSLEQQQADAPADAPAREADPAAGEARKGLMFDTADFTPGWERVRNPNWMEHGKLDEMNVRVGQAGPIDLYLGLNTAGRLQYLRQRNVEIGGVPQTGSLEPGFQTAWGSIEALADLYDGGMEVYFDVYLSNPAHPDAPQGHEGYMLMRRVPGMEDTLIGSAFDVINVKAGQFEIDFGDHR